MTKLSVAPTPYPQINALLHEVLSAVRVILGRRFVAVARVQNLVTVRPEARLESVTNERFVVDQQDCG
jgi:hypothetical protein